MGNRGMGIEYERYVAAAVDGSANETAPSGNVQLCVAGPCKVRDVILLGKNLIRRIYAVARSRKQIKSSVIFPLDCRECFSIRRKRHCGVIIRIPRDGPELRGR